jgi:GT2 family glycosyltransferase
MNSQLSKCSVNNIFTVIVLYKPNRTIDDVLLSHKKNVKNIILVNNSPEINLSRFINKTTFLINNSQNIGLAAAINIGILEAKKQGAQMVALFDQDTLLPDGFSQNMLKHINAYQGSKKPALFSPVYYNHVTDDYGSIINFKPFRLIRTPPFNLKSVIYPH